MRSFLALIPNENLVAFVESVMENLRGHAGDAVRWTPQENLHVTLRFLGASSEAVVREVWTGMKGAAPVEGIPIVVRGVVGYPSPARARAIVLELAGADREAEESIRSLAARADALSRAAGLDPADHTFQPHLTLGRLKGKRKPSPDLASALRNGIDVEPPDGGLELDDLTMMISELHPDGARYRRFS